MTRALKLHWIVWTCLTLFVAIGTIAFRVSTAPTRVALVLIQGAEATTSVFRLRPTPLNSALEFDRTNRSPRPELGSWHGADSKRNANHIEFPDPGQVTKVEVTVLESGASFLLEALPARSFYATMNRSLVPFVDDGDPHRFVWPGDHSLIAQLPIGSTNLRVKVIEVGAAVHGEHVVFYVSPPVTFEGCVPEYKHLWWFYGWPVYASLLLVYFAVLLWKSHRTSSIEPRPQ